ncbi:hypothetical protein F4859DRAFT_513092 [Xylaria cf. heliscus]|nr:hypothetical protein F4859DRAFT_513092 [Xylaria cf. heliscus]
MDQCANGEFNQDVNQSPGSSIDMPGKDAIIDPEPKPSPHNGLSASAPSPVKPHWAPWTPPPRTDKTSPGAMDIASQEPPSQHPLRDAFHVKSTTPPPRPPKETAEDEASRHYRPGPLTYDPAIYTDSLGIVVPSPQTGRQLPMRSLHPHPHPQAPVHAAAVDQATQTQTPLPSGPFPPRDPASSAHPKTNPAAPPTPSTVTLPSQQPLGPPPATPSQPPPYQPPHIGLGAPSAMAQ